MFDATLFDVTSSQYLYFAGLMLAPTLGFMFLFLLGLPLKKIFGIELGDYSPPKWLLPIFSLGSLFVISCSASTGLFLNILNASPSIEKFSASYHKERVLNVPTRLGKIKDIQLRLDEHNGVSNFRVFVNGYRVLGSTSNCRLDFQCRSKDNPQYITEFDALKQELKVYGTIFHLSALYSLPYSQTIFPYVVAGVNYVDLHSEASGLGGCGITASLKIDLDGGSLERTIAIRPERGAPSVTQTESGAVEILYGAGAGGAGGTAIAPYGTHSARGSYRLCERVRLVFDLTPIQIDRSDDRWVKQIKGRRAEIACQIPQRQKACQ